YEDSIELYYSNDLTYIWNNMQTNIDQLYYDYYEPTVSIYNDNLSAWDKWSSYATYSETVAINAILAGQAALLSDMSNDFGDLNSDLDGANDAMNVFNLWWGKADPNYPDNYEAQQMWDGIYHWKGFINEFQPTCGDITNDIIDFDENYQP